MTIFLVYLLAGAFFLVLFDLATKRIRNRLRDSVYKVQERTFTGKGLALAILLVTAWLFWPAVAFGAAESLVKREQKR